jgi:clan AA aspartic protease
MGTETELDVWIDTGFIGDLMLPAAQIAAIGSSITYITEAELADGSEVVLDTYKCKLKWFGKWRSVAVLASQGYCPLLGVGLLRDRELTIDYRTETVTID